MSPADRLLGEPVAEEIRAEVRAGVADLRERGHPPTLATVLMSDDPDDERFVELKHEACEAIGVATRDHRLAPDDPPERLYRTVEDLSADGAVDAVFVQAPLPPGVSAGEVRTRVDPAKDVDCFHPENLGRLVLGEPRFVPATPAAVRRLLAFYDVETAGRDAVVVGRSAVIGRPLANLLSQREAGDATVTVCHSRTADLAAHTRRADVLVTAAGVPGLVDGSMVGEGAVVVDVSANRREDGVVGDVESESVREVASALTPVPGGVGPVTLAALLENVVGAAERRASRAE